MFVLLHGAAIGWVLLGCTILLGIFVRRASPWRVRMRSAALAGIAGPVLGYVVARGLLAATTATGSGTLAWTAAEISAITPARSRAVERARGVLVARILRGIPDPNDFDIATTALLVAGPPVDHESIARYMELSKSEADCRQAAKFLAAVAAVAPDATMAATDAAVSCGVEREIASIAQIRLMASDYDAASRAYDRGAARWAPEPATLFPAELRAGRFQDEALTHLLAGEPSRAGKTLERYPSTTARKPRVECARWALAAIGGDVSARDQLEKSPDIACALELAPLTDRDRRAPLVKRLSQDRAGIVEHLYLVRAWEADDALDPSTTWDDADVATRTIRTTSPDEMFLFAYGARVEDPAVLLDTLARLNALAPPPLPLRLARARYRAVAARFESSAGNDEAARRAVQDALADYRVLLAEVDSKRTYVVARLELESVLVQALGASVELMAGDVDAADARVHALSTWLDEPIKGSDVQASEERDARASVRAIAAYIELFRGRTGAIERFASSEDCKRLSYGFVLQRDLAALQKAARGDATECEDLTCLVAARQPAARAALLKHVDSDIGLMATRHKPVERLLSIGTARRLARAIGDSRYDAAFARWDAALRPRALDVRLAALSDELGDVRMFL